MVFRLSPAAMGWLMIMVGCCSNVLSLEFITKRDKSSGHLITFAQFAYLTAEGLLTQFDFRTGKMAQRQVPMGRYFMLTSLFFLASLINNAALNWNISMPVHTVYRSSGLAATLLSGWLFFGKRYSVHQILSCMLVCVGVVTLTLADGQARAVGACCGEAASAAKPQPTNTTTVSSPPSFHSSLQNDIAEAIPYLNIGPLIASLLDTEGSDLRWAVGISMLTSTLLMFAVLGHLQDQTYKVYGKLWKELMYYTHLLSMPFFLLFWRDIWTHAVKWTNPATYPVVVLPGGYEFVAPLFFYLFINLVTQSVCFKGVSILTSQTSALNCTVALTLRKFFSLLLSIWYFNNSFTQWHWVGATAVFSGIVLYANEGWFGGGTKTAKPLRSTFRSTLNSAHSVADLLRAASDATGRPIPTPAVAVSEMAPTATATDGPRQRRVFSSTEFRFTQEVDDDDEDLGRDQFEAIQQKRTPHVEKLASDLELLQLMGDLGGDSRAGHRTAMDVSPPPHLPSPLSRGISGASNSAKKKRISASTPRERVSRNLHL
jgi:UDP-xylose/UDP-N-acetylglucosamine transporter B4